MDVESIFNDHSILFLEKSKDSQKLFEEWLPGIETRFASTPGQIQRYHDSTVAVASLSKSLLGKKTPKVRKFLLNRNPYCQLVLLLPQSSAVLPYESQYDACLQRPISKEELQTTIERVLVQGVYSSILRESYSLSTKLHWIERSGVSVESELEVSPAELRKRYQHVCGQLDELQRHLDQEIIEPISQSVQLHKRYLREPAEEPERAVDSKYHPDSCPSCELSWGVDHGNELGYGFKVIGANIRKCTRCGEIVHGLGQSGRQVIG